MMIAQLIGALLACALFGRLIWWGLFGKLLRMPDDVPRATGAAVVSYVLMVGLYGFGNANGGPWAPGNAWIFYGIGLAGFLLSDLWRINARKATKRF